MSYKIYLNGLLILSIIVVIWIYFFEDYWIPVIINVNADSLNKLIEFLSLAYIASYMFYFIVVYLKEKQERNIILPFIADYSYVLMNNAVVFSTTFKGWDGTLVPNYSSTIYNRDIKSYPTEDEIKELCTKINPNQEKNENTELPGLKIIPHFFGVMIKYSLDINYFLDIILTKSNFLDVTLLRILTDIKTCGYHKNMTSFNREVILIAKHRENNLRGFERSFNHYFNLLRELEIYADKNLKQFVKRESLLGNGKKNPSKFGINWFREKRPKWFKKLKKDKN